MTDPNNPPAGDQAMTAPEWAVETWRLACGAYEDGEADQTDMSMRDRVIAGDAAAALELSRRCVPIEEYQRVVELANKLDGYTLHKTQCALYQSSYAMNFPECSCGLTDAREDLLTRAALKETGNGKSC